MLRLDEQRAQTLTSEGNGDIDTSQGLSVPFVVVGIRIHFADILSGGGASTAGATVTISRVSDRDADHNVTLRTIASRGVGADLSLAIDPGIYERYRFEGNDKCRVEWTSPDEPDIGYAVSIRALPIVSPTNGHTF